jgi:hypothetical protein
MPQKYKKNAQKHKVLPDYLKDIKKNVVFLKPEKR